MDRIKLNDEKTIPAIGFGVFLVPDDADMQKIRAIDTGVGSHNPDDLSFGETLLKNYKIHD